MGLDIISVFNPPKENETIEKSAICTESEWNKGAKYMRDNVIAHIIGFQNDLGNDTENEKYQVLQELLELIVDQYGNMCGKFVG